jgi:hypothetical protein
MIDISTLKADEQDALYVELTTVTRNRRRIAREKEHEEKDARIKRTLPVAYDWMDKNPPKSPTKDVTFDLTIRPIYESEEDNGWSYEPENVTGVLDCDIGDFLDDCARLVLPTVTIVPDDDVDLVKFYQGVVKKLEKLPVIKCSVAIKFTKDHNDTSFNVTVTSDTVTKYRLKTIKDWLIECCDDICDIDYHIFNSEDSGYLDDIAEMFNLHNNFYELKKYLDKTWTLS